MASDGYVVVQWRMDKSWFCGHRKGFPKWTKDRDKARRFESAAQFREYERSRLVEGATFRWSKADIRFVRVRPRKEAA